MRAALCEVNYGLRRNEKRDLMRMPRHLAHYMSGSGAAKQVETNALKALLDACGSTQRIFRAVPVSLAGAIVRTTAGSRSTFSSKVEDLSVTEIQRDRVSAGDHARA